jgi:hypothetical protein
MQCETLLRGLPGQPELGTGKFCYLAGTFVFLGLLLQPAIQHAALAALADAALADVSQTKVGDMLSSSASFFW